MASVLTASQLQSLKADLDANFPATPDEEAAAAYNQPAAPEFWVWKTRVTRAELVSDPSVDGTTFAWTGTGFITRNQGERDAFNALLAPGFVNPSLANVRQAFQDIFSGGTAPAPANRTHLATVSRMKASRAQKLFATGTGSTASPATMAANITQDFTLSAQDVSEARNLP
jgi:hypothetical protein